MPIVYVQTFEVEGSGDFPFDMLRYDSCYPVREGTDTANLAKRYRGERLEKRVIRLQRIIFDRSHDPTYGRWESFGWKVIPESISIRKI
jgi:hypothetical protein